MTESPLNILIADAISLLQQLIAIPSLSKEENKTAACIEGFLKERKIETQRLKNNVWCRNKYFDTAKPTVLLNSHHDTVAANTGYTRDPFDAQIENGNIYGLGSADAGASLVCLLATFMHYYSKEHLAYNIVFAASAEEEISGSNGIEKIFSEAEFKNLFLHPDSFAIVGEPTELQLAVAEKGLLVLDCRVTGKAGHAARGEGINAIYKAMAAVEWFKNFRFPKISPLLGEVKMSVTSICTENKAHNVIPALCSFVVDVRVNELYTHEEILEIIKQNIDAEIKPRSTRLRSSFIETSHPVVQSGITLGREVYGSPTLSDKALIPLPSLKCGPGNSTQSHTADEFIALKNLEEGIGFYINLLELLLNNNKQSA